MLQKPNAFLSKNQYLSLFFNPIDSLLIKKIAQRIFQMMRSIYSVRVAPEKEINLIESYWFGGIGVKCCRSSNSVIELSDGWCYVFFWDFDVDHSWIQSKQEFTTIFDKNEYRFHSFRFAFDWMNKWKKRNQFEFPRTPRFMALIKYIRIPIWHGINARYSIDRCQQHKKRW